MLSILQPPCEACGGTCCRKTVDHHTFAVLLGSDESYPDMVKVKGIIDPDKIEHVLPYEDGACVYFKDNRCSIYETRPQACREFNCWDGYKSRDGQHSYFLQDHPKVAELLESLSN